jgi:transposase InsO family protein
VVECGSLENCCAGIPRTGGSNPPPSASTLLKRVPSALRGEGGIRCFVASRLPVSCPFGQARSEVRHTVTGSWRTRLALELAALTYIGWYNARRKHRSLKVVEDGRIRRQTPLQALDRYNQEVATLAVASK